MNKRIRLMKGEPPEYPLDNTIYISKHGKVWIKIHYMGTESMHILPLDYYFYSWSALSDWILRILGYNDIESITLLHNKEGRKKLCDMLGRPPKVLHRVFRAIIAELFMADLPLINRLCLVRKFIKHPYNPDVRLRKMVYRYDFNLIAKLQRTAHLIEQLEKDGLLNLAPLVHYYEMSPQELKNKFKGMMWRQLHKNSFSRNILLRGHIDNENSLLPSTILKKFPSTGIDSRCVEACKKSGINYKDFTLLHWNTWRDMRSLALQLDISPRPAPKTWEQIQSLHDRYVKKMMEKENASLSKDIITYNIRPFTVGEEYLCTPLISEYDLYLEGKKMHHCIYSYFNSVRTGKYFVINVENTSTKEISTLGLGCGGFIDDWRVDQHCGPCNGKTNNTIIESQIVKHINLNCKETVKLEQRPCISYEQSVYL